ncbi:hypothetical protein GLYMA_01G216800v4 [Glycine max]|uniref:Uncharacterized protein n=2 Tax=Glycine subgen. Soja TaxID=1462606 RepID=K7K554_SOYBN|nr:hypothetical protein JHK87_002502 [Glycine soja]KAG5070191.1 hypothetical protein JHK85_002568 [Glycine max]KAG5089892.1 hypothetical protein JHK86_002504 [Glycine max]KAH1164255.1 hypothetical protein GYH30_002342 [Glycine max]KRH77491.1 hypothetical protein GLYMA_01G216800v4 [Glycine max]
MQVGELSRPEDHCLESISVEGRPMNFPAAFLSTVVRRITIFSSLSILFKVN